MTLAGTLTKWLKKVNIAHSDDELGLYLFDLHVQKNEVGNKVNEICLKMDQIYKLLAAERDHLRGQKMELDKLAIESSAAADRRVNKAGQY